MKYKRTGYYEYIRVAKADVSEEKRMEWPAWTASLNS